ncbi:unnamed protein product [Camellia sinensis]
MASIELTASRDGSEQRETAASSVRRRQASDDGTACLSSTLSVQAKAQESEH